MLICVGRFPIHLVEKVLSFFFGVTGVSKKGMDPSGLVYSIVN